MKTGTAHLAAQIGLSAVLLGALALASGGGEISEARAEAAGAQRAIGTGKKCVLKGASRVGKGEQIFDASSGGRAIASFTGNAVGMQMTEIPADPVKDRAKVVTSLGMGSFRIEGYVAASAVPVFTTRDAPIMTGTVWIASGQKVEILHAGSDRIDVARNVSGSRNVRARARTTCDGLALAVQKGAPTPAEIPPNARVFLTKGLDTELYDQPNGDAVFSFMMLEGSAQLLWSTESRAGFVHVRSRSDLVVDGWIRWRDLTPLKRGEMMGTPADTSTPPVEVRFAFDSPPRIVEIPKDISIRAAPREDAKLVGVVEAGAPIYVLERSADWTNVLPKSLNLLPPDDGGFWIPANEIPN